MNKRQQQETYAIMVSSHLLTALNRFTDNIRHGMNSLFKPMKVFVQNLTFHNPLFVRVLLKLIMLLKMIAAMGV